MLVSDLGQIMPIPMPPLTSAGAPAAVNAWKGYVKVLDRHGRPAPGVKVMLSSFIGFAPVPVAAPVATNADGVAFVAGDGKLRGQKLFFVASNPADNKIDGSAQAAEDSTVVLNMKRYGGADGVNWLMWGAVLGVAVGLAFMLRK
jgi:hypothetical protein